MLLKPALLPSYDTNMMNNSSIHRYHINKTTMDVSQFVCTDNPKYAPQ